MQINMKQKNSRLQVLARGSYLDTAASLHLAAWSANQVNFAFLHSLFVCAYAAHDFFFVKLVKMFC